VAEQEDGSCDLFTHFQSTGAEMPSEYYFALGRALYRWGQVETYTCSIAVSLLNIPWLESVERLRGTKGFAVKNTFEQIDSAIRKCGGDALASKAISEARRLYELRNMFFHSTWGHISGPKKTGVGIQEWSSTSYANFRPISVLELQTFAQECTTTAELLMQSVIPFLHNCSALAIDDETGRCGPAMANSED
jgi:hypothetical protein